MAEDNIGLHHKFEMLKGVEQHKNMMIEDLLSRLDKLSEDFQQEKLDHARESQFNRDVQRRELLLTDELRKFKAMVERDPFILVLIDGDGMIFEDHLIKKGEAGGKEAAAALWAATRDYIHQTIPGLSPDYKIVARIYANLKGLGDVCHRAAILETPATIEKFARGFTGSKQLFDFIDVGEGKDRADDKISEIFKLHFYDCHCRHILFGCSHDNGYARILEDFADQTVMNRITLLEGVPFEKELATLKSKYKTTKFEGLFRTAKINLYQQQYFPPQGPPLPTIHSLNQPLPIPATQYQSPYQPVMSRTPPISNSSSSSNPTAGSWATTAISNNSRLASPPPTPQPISSASAVIPRNRFGQRIDPPIKFDQSDVKRVKDMHMCNVHFLREDCPYGRDCTHDHSYKPNKNELQTLKYVARLTPCRFGSECDEIKCIYGHRCPVGETGRKDCRWGPGCRFEREMHGIDLNVVRTTKIGGK